MFIFAYVFITSQNSLSFPGGNVHSLTSTIASASGKPVVISCNMATQFKKFSFELKDPKDLVRLIRVKTGLESQSKNALGLSFSCLPDEIYSRTLTRAPQTAPVILRPSLLVQDGIVNGKSTAEALISVKDLKSLGWSKPLKVHWAFEKYQLAFSATKASEIQFLTAVSNAIGAKLSSTDKEFSIDFDSDEYRKRAINSLTSGEPYELRNSPKDILEVQAREQLGVQILRTASNKQLSEAFVAPGNGFLIDAPPGSPIFSASSTLIASMRACATQTDRDHISASNGMKWLLNLIDPTKPLKGMFRSPISFAAAAQAKDGGSVVL